MKRAAALLRVSTADQAESGWGLPEQRGAIGAYCRRHGIDLVEMCEDDGVSGRMTERPAVKRVMELARAGSIDTLVLIKLDRLGRDNRVIQELLHRFRGLGLDIRFVDHASGDTASDRLLLNVLGGISEFEMEQIRARTMAGRRRKAEAGRMPVTFRLFGYHCVRKWEEAADPANISGELRIIEEEAAIVRELFARYDQGESMGSLTRWLNAEGHRTRLGNEWRHTTLRITLKNPTYKGEARYGWRSFTTYVERTDAGEQKRHRVTTQDDFIVIPCPAIIEPDLWQRVQDRLDGYEGPIRGRPSLLWPLRGCVRCETCCGLRGAPRVAVGKRKSRNRAKSSYLSRAYVCNGCNASVAADKWEKKALERFREAVEPGVQEAGARKQAEKELAAAGNVLETVEKLRAQIRQLDEDERKLLDMAALFSPHIIQERARSIQDRRKTVQAKIAETEQKRAGLADPGKAERLAGEKAAELRALLETDDMAELAPLFRRHVRITLRKGKTARLQIVL